MRKPIIGFNYITCFLESSLPINVYIVDSIGFQSYLSGDRSFYSHGRFRGTTVSERFMVPHDGDWYLIFDNQESQDAAIHYEVH